jgi:hypothetical protein
LFLIEIFAACNAAIIASNASCGGLSGSSCSLFARQNTSQDRSVSFIIIGRYITGCTAKKRGKQQIITIGFGFRRYR